MTAHGPDPPTTDHSEDTLGIRRVGIGGGSPEGENSAYLLPSRRTVVDPGPPGDASWNSLCSGMRAVGLTPADVEHVVVTHWHADHAGLAPRLREVADATLWMGEADAPYLRNYAIERERRVERDSLRLREWDVPEVTIAELGAGDTPSPFPDEVPVRSLPGGETVGETDLVALHVPGHTAGHVAIRVPGHANDRVVSRVPGHTDDHVAARVPPCGDDGSAAGEEAVGLTADSLLVGDLVLPTYTPNVGGGDTRMDRPLSTYLESLDRVMGLIDTGEVRAHGYPGHGSQLNMLERIGEIREHHEARAARVLEAVEHLEGVHVENGPTPWDIARELFGEMDGIHAKMGAGEAASHLAELVAEGTVARVGESPVRFSAVV